MFGKLTLALALVAVLAAPAQARDRSATDTQMALMAATFSLSYLPPNHRAHWGNPETGNSGSSFWYAQFENTKGHLCRRFWIELQGFAPEEHIGCLTNRNTWIVDRKWILSYDERRHTNPSCVRLFSDTRLDRGRTHYETSICKISPNQWQVLPERNRS